MASSIAAALDPSGELPLDPRAYFIHLTLVIGQEWNLRLARALAGCDIDLAAFRALRVVRYFEAPTMGEVADYSLIDRTTLTRVVDDLADRGFIRRRRGARDRRKVVLTLTPAGRESFDRAVATVLDEIAQLTTDLPESELRSVVRLQQEIVRRLSDGGPQTDRLLWRPRG